MNKQNPVGNQYDLSPGADGIKRLSRPQAGSPDAAPPAPPANASEPPPLRESYGLTKRPEPGAPPTPDHPITGGVDSERASVRSVEHPFHAGKKH